ncbi:MAG: PAS domain S-box protein [Nitrospirae bacterium]|nr:PAS domain S-box protein [Nitrospirota bacterium]
MVSDYIEVYFIPLSTFIVIILLSYILLRLIIIKQRRSILKTEGIINQTEKKDDLGFIVDTFHSMVRELKDKEKELQRLMSLAEEKAESIESYNENILRSVASGVVTFDSEGRIITFNPASESILKINAEEVIGKICEEVFGEHSPLTRAQKESLRMKEGIPRIETTLKTNKGEKIWLGMNTSLLRDTDGELIGLILVFSDLTEIKQLQSQIELKERFALLGEMSAGIAHELRNPMGAIAGFAKLLSKKLTYGDERKPLVDAIGKEIDGMNRVINELLTFAKPTDLNLSKVELKPLIEDSLTLIPLNSVISNINTEQVSFINADEILLKQVFINLFQNAVEAMPGGGELKIVVIHNLQAENQIPEVEIVISDTGMGISEDKLKKIFHPFFTTKENGTGLGLSLVQKIILYHGGRIEVESKEGKGTTFRIALPVTHCGENF